MVSSENWRLFLCTEAVVRWCSVKKVFLEIHQNSQESTCASDSFLIKLQACNFIKKESLVQAFSCEFGEISKKTFFYRTPLVAASVQRDKKFCKKVALKNFAIFTAKYLRWNLFLINLQAFRPACNIIKKSL